LAQIPDAARRDIGNLTVENIPVLPADLLARVEQYQNVRSAAVADWDLAGKGLFVGTRSGEVPQIYHVAGPGAERRQITSFKEPLTTVAVSPDKKFNGFIYSRDEGGNEQYQIYFFDLGTGQSRLLTDGKSRNLFEGWNHAGTQLAYMSNQRNDADLDLFVQDFAAAGTTKPTALLELKGGGWEVAAWSDDGRQMVLRNFKSVNESELFHLDVASRKLEQLHRTKTPVAYGGFESSVAFSADGKGLFLVSDEESEFQTLRHLDLASGKLTALSASIPWDVTGLDRSKDGSKLVFRTNEGGYSKLYVLDTKTRAYKAVSNLPRGLISRLNLHDDGRRLALTMSTGTTAADAYVLDLNGNQLTRWTTSETGGLNPTTFPEPTLIQYPTFDQVNGKPRMIPAFVYRPKNATGKTPVLLSIHGGPESQSLPTFSPLNALLANELGITIVVPNVRGSTGYGKTYVALDNGLKREDSVKDIGALLDWIATQPTLDASRVAVYGGSYGGYMSLATMTNYNAWLRCGIDLFGISNFATFLKNTSPYRADLRRAEYGDERDPAMLATFDKISPINNIRNITKPMLVYQGKNDPRVPLSESEQMVAGLKKQGNTVWYIMAKDEGHSLAKKSNSVYTQGAMLLFLRENLLK
jgi:dipeptidyl aminopeptidase/acylaminoacyl peptidase